MDSPTSARSPSIKERLYDPDDEIVPTSDSVDWIDRLTFEDLQSRIRRLRFNYNNRQCWIYTGAFVVLIIFINLIFHLHPTNVQIDGVAYDRSTWLSLPDRVIRFEKPKEFPIVAVVLFSHRDRASILDCYLRRNLVENGGFLDEVIFVMETGREDTDSVVWLNNLVAKTKGYSIGVSPHETPESHYEHLWDVCNPGTLYIQMSDQIVFFEDTTIPSLVKTKLDNPDSFLVSANVVNHPATSWLHHQLGVVKPYLPELKPPVRGAKLPPRYDYWRASDLPPWDGPDDFKVPESYRPPFHGHRWLPTNRSTVDNTVALNSEFSFNGPGIFSWPIGAQHQYSFLEHLENNDLWRYKFPLWDHQYERMAITFICIWGEDISTNGPIPKGGDHFLTVELPRSKNRRK